ncbi:hypothetical protein CB423_02170 [Salmonella enterica subsp. diarizonae]|nr:hypothetical protein [Salmonella enterica subsp. diarizonae]
MIITGNSVPIGVNTAGASVSSARLYTPRGDVSRWIAGIDSVAGNQDWKITTGANTSTWYYMTPTKSGSQWEIQHPMPGSEDFFKYGFRVRFSCYFDDVDVATMEGKVLLELRLIMPDSAIPAGTAVPAATPDKPYLAFGFIVRCVDGKYKIYDLDTDVTSSDATITSQTIYQRSTQEFSLRCESYNVYSGVGPYGRYLKPIRTGVNTPANTLCIRSGANPVKETGFSYLESVIPRESIKHTLTAEDNNATFYCPWGYRGNLTVIFPDTPLPEGFCVNLVAGDESYINFYPEGKNATWNRTDGKPSSGNTFVAGKNTLIQTGKNGKTWLLI